MSLSYTNMKLLCPCAAEVYAYAAVCEDTEKHTRHTIICWSCDKPLGVVPARMLFVGETAGEAKAGVPGPAEIQPLRQKAHRGSRVDRLTHHNRKAPMVSR